MQLCAGKQVLTDIEINCDRILLVIAICKF